MEWAFSMNLSRDLVNHKNGRGRDRYQKWKDIIDNWRSKISNFEATDVIVWVVKVI